MAAQVGGLWQNDGRLPTLRYSAATLPPGLPPVSWFKIKGVPPASEFRVKGMYVPSFCHSPPTCSREIGILLPNNQHKPRTLHSQKDVLPCALC